MDVSRGADGDHNLWWATTEGYLAIGVLKESASAWAGKLHLPSAADTLGGWWDRVSGARVQAGPTTDAPILGQIGAVQASMRTPETKRGAQYPSQTFETITPLP